MTTPISNQLSRDSSDADPAEHAHETVPSARTSLTKRLLVFAVLAVCVIATSVGTWALLTAIDRSVSAEGGYEFSTDTYAVRFPGEPEVGSQEIPGAAISLETAQWQNKQKIYAVAHFPARDAAATLDDALAGALQATGATLVQTEDIAIDGGTAMIAQSAVGGEMLWTMIVFSDDGAFFTIGQSGEQKDQAFFESFRLL